MRNITWKVTKSSVRRKRTSQRRGVVMIEFCIAFFFIFLPLCMALLQYGMIIQATLAMNNLSREAGRYASVNSLNAKDDTDLKNYITSNALGLGIVIKDPTNDIVISPKYNDPLAATKTRVRYNPITISITYNLNPRSFLQSPFTAVFHIPIFRSNYTTSVVMVMQQ